MMMNWIEWEIGADVIALDEWQDASKIPKAIRQEKEKEHVEITIHEVNDEQWEDASDGHWLGAEPWLGEDRRA